MVTTGSLRSTQPQSLRTNDSFGKTAARRLGIEDPGSKTFFRGTHRAVTPEQTLEHVRGVFPAMGITRVANVTGLDSIDIPVVMVFRPNAFSLSVSQGKGVTLAAAKASGVMESIEAYHAEHITLPLKLASFEELRYTHSLLDPVQLAQPAQSRYHPYRQMLWVEAEDLQRDERVWLPFEPIHLNYTLPSPPGSGCFIASSNGLASGNHILEAISHAICEVVERDAVALWRLRGKEVQRTTRINLATVDDPDCRELLKKYERAGIDVGVWDATSDIGIATFVCLIAERTPNPTRRLPVTNNFGCHPARSVALARALTETAQSRLTYIAGSRDNLLRRDYQAVLDGDVQERFRRLLTADDPRRDFHEVPSYEGETFLDDVQFELSCLRSVGIERVLLVDLTHPELRIQVVRIVIPGLEPLNMSPDSRPGARARQLLESCA
jgi:ribosomal protein S12 methylthiotransferase accessory factor